MSNENGQEEPTPEPKSSVLPAAPWYTSPVQIAGVVAALSQVGSILVRWFGLPVSDAQLDQYSADALQIITIGATGWAIFKRQRSDVAPLTMTRRGADRMAEVRPSVLDNDPTKQTKT